MNVIVFVILLMLILGGLPGVGIAPAGWGYYPSGGLGLVLLILIVLALLGRV